MRALEERRVGSINPSRVCVGDKGVTGRNEVSVRSNRFFTYFQCSYLSEAGPSDRYCIAVGKESTTCCPLPALHERMVDAGSVEGLILQTSSCLKSLYPEMRVEVCGLTMAMLGGYAMSEPPPGDGP